ncbi:MAG: MgtC/SapB family protein [Microscillaceae bacterium]|nr:MgtC/SapB family protein [Microscillaceae bacterium]MDW8460652.1 MgtC/SapB family protein [Cytophagales bacterium]
MTLLDFSLRLGLAFLLGAAIGLERQWRQKSAGLRTNTLVSLGSAAFTLISFSITSLEDGVYKGDATRIIGQVVTGIGFLGAGVIMKDGMSIHGLNTAATIWCSASVGALAAVGLFAEASVVAGAIILTHILLRPVSIILNRLSSEKEEESYYYYSFKIRCKEQVENHLRVLILNTLRQDKHLKLHSLKSSDNGNPAYAYIEAVVFAIGNHDAEMEKLAGMLTLEYGVTEVSWEINQHTNVSTESES